MRFNCVPLSPFKGQGALVVKTAPFLMWQRHHIAMALTNGVLALLFEYFAYMPYICAPSTIGLVQVPSSPIPQAAASSPTFCGCNQRFMEDTWDAALSTCSAYFVAFNLLTFLLVAFIALRTENAQRCSFSCSFPGRFIMIALACTGSCTPSCRRQSAMPKGRVS